MSGRILVGTSSWADPGFVEEWYPPGMAARDRLPFYAERFEFVEVNSSFYAIPEQGTVARWAEVTPDGFTFDYKLHRALSRHAADVNSLPPDLRDGLDLTPRGRVRLTTDLEAALLDRTCEAVVPLEQAGKLGAFLLQLTPAFAPSRNCLDELDALIEEFAPDPIAVELRHRYWLVGEQQEATLAWFEQRGVPFVCVDSPPGEHVPILPPIDAVTLPRLAYLRAHGRNREGYTRGRSVAERFAYDYGDEELREIGGRTERLAAEAQEVRTMFNNNRGMDAPTSARRMRELVGQDPGPSPHEGQLQVGR